MPTEEKKTTKEPEKPKAEPVHPTQEEIQKAEAEKQKREAARHRADALQPTPRQPSTVEAHEFQSSRVGLTPQPFDPGPDVVAPAPPEGDLSPDRPATARFRGVVARGGLEGLAVDDRPLDPEAVAVPRITRAIIENPAPTHGLLGIFEACHSSPAELAQALLDEIGPHRSDFGAALRKELEQRGGLARGR